MCGICGYFQSVARADLDVLRVMNSRIVHRGPDDDGFFFNGRAGLAARRLSIIDLTTGHQPLASQSGKCWIAFNGEIYNFPELRKDLLARGYLFRTASDTEVVVNLYEEYGLDFVHHLRGMFAAAIYDGHRDRLVLARDRIGKKPLYYTVNDGNLVFASEIKCILEYPGIPRRIDETALDLFLTLEYVPAPHSMFAGIHKLPAGHLLVFENGRETVSRYWEVGHTLQPRTRPLAELREEFMALLDEAVRIRMISDVPLGAFLSGGIDSSAVVAAMARQSGEPIRTFSIGFSDKSYSELAYSRQVSEAFHTDHFVRVLQPDIRELVTRLSAHLDEPLGDFSNFPTYLVSQIARERVTVALSGDGGDEIFGGYEHYVAQKAAAPLDFPLLRPLHPLLAGVTHLFPPSELKKGWVNRIKRMSEGFRHHPSDRHFRWMIFLGGRDKKRLYTPEFFRPEFARRLAQRAPFAEHFAAAGRFPGLNRDLYLDLKTYLVDDIMVKVDRMSMAVSLESRAPLLDHKVVEFAFSLPPEMKVRGGVTKWFFKKAMEGVLPENIIYRRKEGFSIPIKNWLRGELKELMLDTLTPERLEPLGCLRFPAVKEWMVEHLNHRENHSHRLWPLILLVLWHENYIQR